MKFKNLLPGRLKKRYKRFLVDVALADGSQVTAHCPNTGSMRGCLAEGNPVLLSRSDSSARKYPLTLEMIQVNGFWVGVNTARSNHLVREAIDQGVVMDFGRVSGVQPEVRVSEKSRLDFLLHRGSEKIYLEVKNCTLVEGQTAMFPDAVTSRGTKHLLALAELAPQGHGAAILFCVQRMDGESFAPAVHIDPVYARTLATVAGQGVMVLAYQALVGPREIRLTHALPVRM
ncbi:MAG: DNA/RNA nuclease SfsA [Deltaproteobacteria bacterium]|nr:DNA/RNA nuclease SfsA [Deltaproteobacteria bacterium]